MRLLWVDWLMHWISAIDAAAPMREENLSKD